MMIEIERRRADDEFRDELRRDIGKLARFQALMHREQRAHFAAEDKRAESVPPWIKNHWRDVVWGVALIAAIMRGDTASLVGYLTGRASTPTVVAPAAPTLPSPAPEPTP